MMLLVSLVLGVAVFFMLETFSNFQEFDLIDATVLHYKNITGPIPERPQGTLTYSIQKRVSEIYGYKGPGSGYNAYEMTLQGQSAAKEFYRRYLNGYVNKISKVSILSQTHPTTKFFTINNERIFQSAKSYIDVFVLDDQKLYGLPQAEPTEMEWRTCFSHQINGSAEAVAYNEDKNTLVSVINHHTKKGRTIRVYNELSCDYRDSIDSTTHMEHFCSENEKYAHKSHICEGFDLKSVTPKVHYDAVKTLVSYDDIRVSSDSKIANIAAGNNIIAYTTIGEHMKIHYTYKHEEHGWVHQTIDYSTREKLRSFKYHQNLGLMFIGSTSSNEQQLLVVDAIANDVRLDLIYFSYTFVGGKVLEDEDAKVLGNYTLEAEEEFDLNEIYHSEMQELFKLEVSEELNSIDPLNSMSLPNSILKYNSKTKQILVVSLERYILLICPQGDEGNFYGFVLSDFEDQAFKIKSVDISPTGIYFAFLVNYKNSTKAFILKNEYIYNVAINKLFLVNFDYSLNSGKKQILDLRLIKNVENDMILMVLLESGEIASYGLRTGATKVKGSLIDILIEEDMDYLYMLLLFTAVCALVTVKFARSIRINVNIRRRVAPQ